MNIKAFVYSGSEDEFSFCNAFFNSPEFTAATLQKILSYSGSKEDLAFDLAERFTRNKISADKIIKYYAEQGRQWVAYKYGTLGKLNTKNVAPISEYLSDFGKNGQWYGPVNLADNSSVFIKSSYNSFFQIIGSGEAKETIKALVRWPIIAKVNADYISFHWNGFSSNTAERIDTKTQFDFWNSVPQAFNEIEEIVGGEYEYPIVNKLILNNIWNKYLPNKEYEWKHLAVRAESAGVALNARSAGVKDINVKGLLALANRLSNSVVDGAKLCERCSSEKIKLVSEIENVVIKTLIQEWGTKSYEFSLDNKNKRIFRAHCFFGSKPGSTTQDQFPHFKAYKQYGGDSKIIDFLIHEDL